MMNSYGVFACFLQLLIQKHPMNFNLQMGELMTDSTQKERGEPPRPPVTEEDYENAKGALRALMRNMPSQVSFLWTRDDAGNVVHKKSTQDKLGGLLSQLLSEVDRVQPSTGGQLGSDDKILLYRLLRQIDAAIREPSLQKLMPLQRQIDELSSANFNSGYSPAKNRRLQFAWVVAIIVPLIGWVFVPTINNALKKNKLKLHLVDLVTNIKDVLHEQALYSDVAVTQSKDLLTQLKESQRPPQTSYNVLPRSHKKKHHPEQLELSPLAAGQQEREKKPLLQLQEEEREDEDTLSNETPGEEDQPPTQLPQ